MRPVGCGTGPMIYTAGGKRFIVVAVGWKGMPGELVAFALA
jgi:hypothetical protein